MEESGPTATTTLVSRPETPREPKPCTCVKIPEVQCLHFLAKTGQFDKLKEALSHIPHNADIFTIDSRKRTILHYAANFRGDHEASHSCVNLIISEAQDRSQGSWATDNSINAKDELGQTALYLGVKCENLAVCESLINAGADWDILCNRRKSPIQKIFKKIPHVLITVFLQDLTKSVKYANEEASEIWVNLLYLVGNSSPEDLRRNKLAMYEETDFLSNLCYTPLIKREEILSHPIVKAFIYLKWKKIKMFFWIARVFQTVWALVYFWFLMEVYRKLCPFPSSQQYQFEWFRIVPNLEVQRGSQKSSHDFPSEEPNHCRSYKWIELTAIALLIMATFDLLYFEVHPTYVRFQRYWYPMKKVNMRKCYKRVILFFRIMYLEKIFLLLTIFLNAIPLLVGSSKFGAFKDWQYISASIGVFLTWLHIFLQIGKIPRLAVYIKMLEKVLTTLGMIILIYISLIFAFAMVFCMLFPGVPAYSSPIQGILKMITFLIGQVDYERNIYDESPGNISASVSTSMVFYGIAILVLNICLLNYLIALTVTDVQNIEQYREVWQSFSLIWQIWLFETFLARFPFKIGKYLLRRISIVSTSAVRKRGETSNQNIEKPDMEIKIRLKDLPKPLSKEIREMIHENQQTSKNAQPIELPDSS